MRSGLLADVRYVRYSRYAESAAYPDYRPVERRMHHLEDCELVMYSIQCCQSGYTERSGEAADCVKGRQLLFIELLGSCQPVRDQR